jgi:hypothetical protein
MSVKTSNAVQANRGVFNEIKTNALTTEGYTTTTKNVGTSGTGVTATEYGDGVVHRTVLLINQTNAVGLVTDDNASLGSGYKIYTFPTGSVVIDAVHMDVGLTSVDHVAETPKVGLGTVIASGTVAVLNGTATFMNILTEQATDAMDGSSTAVAALPTTTGYPLLVSSDDVFFNMALAWANVTGSDADNTVDIAGTVTLLWRFLA